MKLCGKMNAGTVIALVVGIVTALHSAGVWGAEPEDERVRFEAEGSGETVWFLPGLMSSPDIYDAAIAGQDDIRAVKLSFAGMAGTPPVAEPEPYIEPAVAAVVAGLEAEEDPVRLVGHSMGGLISLLAAAERPDRVEAVLVVDSAPFLAGLMQPGATPEGAAAYGAAMKAQMAGASGEQFLGVVQMGLPRQASGEATRARIMEEAAASDKASAVAAMVELMSTDYSDRLAGLGVPVTVLVPHHEAIGVGEEALLSLYKAQYGGLENVSFRLVTDSRHFIMDDQPDAFAAELSRWLDGGQ